MNRDTVLIETCLELGPFSEEQVAEALEATANHPHIKALISWVEYKIGTEHAAATARNQETRLRDEACGAAAALKELRSEILSFVRAGLADAEAKSH